MRHNGPVTQREYELPPSCTLVSSTDLKGRILYGNPAFVDVSGYTREELLGQPHNLIRHPDMPEEAFRDLWATIEQGRPWSGVVKNRRKNGDHYWVYANVTPLLEDGRPVGYLSVRTRPTREQVAQAERLYAALREDEQSRRPLRARLAAGKLRRRGWAGRLDALGRLGDGLVRNPLPALLAIGGFAIGQAAPAVGGAGDAIGWTAALGLALAGHIGMQWTGRRRLVPMRGYVDRLAGCDLAIVPPPSRHPALERLWQSLGQLRVNLMSVLRDAQREMGHVSLAAQEIAAGNDDLSRRTETQAARLEQTASAMTEIASAVASTSEAARQASARAEATLEAARAGTEAAREMQHTMQSIEAAATRIGDITRLIDEISFQTNILALNASVEAARAGDAGRGFAVVAGEVRSLARRTTEAAQDIRNLVEQSQSTVRVGVQQAEQVGRTIDDAVDRVAEMSTLVGEISRACHEQHGGVSQVREALGELDAITQQNVAMVEQLAAAASGLRDRSRALEEAVDLFRLADAPPRRAADAVALRRRQRASRATAAA
ncbi:MAG: methyl-accepting chemotaxis protein [Pseudomonadota bacterium]